MSNFIKLVEEIDDSRVIQELDELLQQVIDGVATHGTEGCVLLKLKIRKEGDRAVITACPDAKVPQAPPAPALYFFDKSGTAVSRQNPRQLTLKDIGPPTIKDATGTAPITAEEDDDNG